jgi:hypothetical protein
MQGRALNQKWRNKYRLHKATAALRGIDFLLTFKQWFEIWESSGHMHERGRRKGEYVMARKGDRGAYALGNIKIITQDENSSEKRFTLRKSARKKMSASAKRRDRSAGYSNDHKSAIAAGVARYWDERRKKGLPLRHARSQPLEERSI